MSDLIEPKVANQLPVAPLPLLGTDLFAVSRDGVILLQSTLSEILARANHTGTQPTSTISGLTEAVQDIVGAQLVAGSNVSIVYDDAAGTTTISASGGGGALTQTLNTASATSGIAVSTGANIVRISPAISSNVNFPITGGAFGDALTLFVPQNATGGWIVVVDGIDYTEEGLPSGDTQIVIKLEHDGTNWNVTNTPIWN
jgi:hypothetical protein